MAKKDVIKYIEIDLVNETMREFKPQVYEIKSENDSKQVYHVTNYRPYRFSCTCKDYLYRSHDTNGNSNNHKCKHIRQVLKRYVDKGAM